MASDEASRRYAQAAFAIALDDGTIDQWRADLADIATVLTGSDLELMFDDDRITVEERQALLGRVLDISPKALNLAKLLVAKGRSRGAAFVAKWFEELANEHEGRIAAEIVAAVPLDAAQIAGIERQLTSSVGKQVTASATVDPSLIGGVIVRVGDQLIDGSVRTRLRRLQKSLEGAA
jgi:F-type H+-transporting ATPase subunit delta